MPNPLINALEALDEEDDYSTLYHAKIKLENKSSNADLAKKKDIPTKWGGNIFSTVKRDKKTYGSARSSKLKPAEYTSKPVLDPMGKVSYGQEYFGVELELEADATHSIYREEMAYDANRVLNDRLEKFCIIKHDGSLQNGFEICTRPATMACHKAAWQEFFDKLPAGLVATERCGMHIHVSKAALTELQIGKIISFIHNKENAKLIKKIAGRESCHYSNYSSPLKHRHALYKHINNFSHYSAVNVLNSNTVELRIFASTVNYALFIKNMEFFHALVKFAVPGTVSISDSTNRFAFLKFLNENRKFYPHLVSFLYENGYSKSLKSLTEAVKVRELI
jgi:hypothetical protein